MIKQLMKVIKAEKQSLENLLKLLDEQYKLIVDNNVFGMEAIVEKIKLCNKDVAEQEVERRKLVGSNSMVKLVSQSGDQELKNEYEAVVKLIETLQRQKDTNELLIKQQLSFNMRIMNIINPSRQSNTYNSYGNLNRK